MNSLEELKFLVPYMKKTNLAMLLSMVANFN